jgi:hypothetical protein
MGHRRSARYQTFHGDADLRIAVSAAALGLSGRLAFGLGWGLTGFSPELTG